MTSLTPILGEIDQHLFGEGRHRRLWEILGAHAGTLDGVDGVMFAVWAPNARAVAVVGDMNGWDARRDPMTPVGVSGIWRRFVPGAKTGHIYKYAITGADGHRSWRADPMARAAERPPANGSVVTESTYVWGDGAWLERRQTAVQGRQPLRVYEVHLGSWRWDLQDYREIAPALVDHVVDLGFTHVELMPIAEHPFSGSWGYQVTGYYAPTARYGDPDGLRYLIDMLHQRNIGVIMDWVPAHFPRDEWALARFDGTALYEHLDPRQGEHPDWGTLIFNFGRNEVRNFLLANALYWLEEFHVDGLRVDAVASMLYLDYSRGANQWVPNRYGGRENLEALQFVKELNTIVHDEHAGVLTIAEESTAWPGVTAPVHYGGLGFTHKWNLGWMHDTLGYFTRDPIHRQFHHRELTFGMLYAWSESYVLPLSHDEVVHGKGSLLSKMAGDLWQRFANLRALYTWMWAHPGRKLLFMGSEIASWNEWTESAGLEWHLLEFEPHRGVRDLVRGLNAMAMTEPALSDLDHEPGGFRWLDADDAAGSIYGFLRFPAGGSERVVACIANFTPVPREGYRVGLPYPGTWRVLIDSDARQFGGGGYCYMEEVEATDVPWQGCGWSAVVPLPPLAVLLLGRP